MSIYTTEDMIEIGLPTPEHFLLVKETLTRIGVASKKEKTLYQSCHIFHKQGRYYICHFKEMFAADGKPTNFTENDIARRNTIVNLLADWKLVTLMDAERTKEPVVEASQIKILPHKEKADWQLVAKYTIGKTGVKNNGM